MRLLYLCLDDLSRPGAWRSHVHGITGALARGGWAVRVVAPGRGGLDLPAGVDGRALSVAGSRPGRIWDAAMGHPRAIADELAAFQPDVVYTRGVHILGGWRTAIASAVPLVVEINGYAEDEAPAWLRARVRRAHVRAFARASAVTVVSGKLRTDMIRTHGLPPDRVFVVANGADLGNFRPLDRDACRRRLGWGGNPTVLFVGSFYAHHALEVLVRAAEEVRRARPEAKFVLAGEGAERGRITSLAQRLGLEGMVRLPGAVPPAAVPEWIGAADVCVLTLRSLRTPERGCSPIKLYEYMAGARPVAVMVDSREVAADVLKAGAGLARVATGRESDDAAALARDILELLSDPARAAAMGAAGRRAAEEMFNWDRAGARVDAILKAAAGRGGWPGVEEAWERKELGMGNCER